MSKFPFLNSILGCLRGRESFDYHRFVVTKQWKVQINSTLLYIYDPPLMRAVRIPKCPSQTDPYLRHYKCVIRCLRAKINLR